MRILLQIRELGHMLVAQMGLEIGGVAQIGQLCGAQSAANLPFRYHFT